LNFHHSKFLRFECRLVSSGARVVSGNMRKTLLKAVNCDSFSLGYFQKMQSMINKILPNSLLSGSARLQSTFNFEAIPAYFLSKSQQFRGKM